VLVSSFQSAIEEPFVLPLAVQWMNIITRECTHTSLGVASILENMSTDNQISRKEHLSGVTSLQSRFGRERCHVTGRELASTLTITWVFGYCRHRNY
jgi:hypothetical protein